LLALGAATLALFAVYVPTEVQGRYIAPLYLLLGAPFSIAVCRVSGAVRTASAARLALGTLGVAVVLGAGAIFSIWLQAQAPLLVGLRAGTIGPNAVVKREARPTPAAGPTAIPGPTVPPAREIPVAKYQAELPRELTASRSSELDLTVTNAGQETWNTQGAYPANIAVRFIAQSTDLYERVKGLMRDSQPTDLPRDVAPGEAVTVRLRFVAPPEAGRYTMRVHVTRPGVPDSDKPLERTVRVVS
jgi:hypothetical protein